MVALKTMAHEVSDGLQIYKKTDLRVQEINLTKLNMVKVTKWKNWWGQPEPVKSSLNSGPIWAETFTVLKLRSEAD